MNSLTAPDFWITYKQLPPEIKLRARLVYACGSGIPDTPRYVLRKSVNCGPFVLAAGIEPYPFCKVTHTIGFGSARMMNTNG